MQIRMVEKNRYPIRVSIKKTLDSIFIPLTPSVTTEKNYFNGK